MAIIPKKTTADPAPFDPKPLRYPCAARGCWMVGSIFAEGKNGVCGYHYDALPQDWPRVTQKLADWQCVTDEILAARRAQIDKKTCLDQAAMDLELVKAWRFLKPQVPAWIEQLQPLPNQTYRDWGKMLEKFMNVRLASKAIAE